MTLADVLAPISVDNFLHQYVGQEYVVIRGARGRFGELVSWALLDEALSRLRVADGRVSLVRNAQTIPRETYVQVSQSGNVQYLIGPAVTKHVASGATLVVHQVDELFSGVRQLTESCEDVFRTYVAANLYAGWRTDNGFDVHWDSHDTLIVQTMGRKDWKVWGPTRLHPLAGDGRDVTPMPTEAPVWEGTLEEGDTLYMPRGWWHVAYPRNEPSVHVTVGLNHSTGANLMEWVADQARACLPVRMDVPHWKRPEERTVWIQMLREQVLSVLDDDVVDRYMRHLDERAHSRPVVRLPQTSASASAVGEAGIGETTPLRLRHGRRLHFESCEQSGMKAFTVQGRKWRCSEVIVPALALLNHVNPCSLEQMRKAVAGEAAPILRPFLTALLSSDVIWAEPLREADTVTTPV